MSASSQHGAKPSVVLFYETFGPHHWARLRESRRLLAEFGANVVGGQVFERSLLHPWTAEFEDGGSSIYTALPGQDGSAVPARAAARAVVRLLGRLHPDVIAWAGYADRWNRAILRWARSRRKGCVLLTDSKADDYTRRRWKEAIKSAVVREFDAVLASGQRSLEYTVSLGIPGERIFLGSDVVDNEYFATAADRARADAPRLREAYGLPESYFLFVGRYDPVKNLTGLLEAYARYQKRVPSPWALVLCGSGEQEPQIRAARDSLGLSSVRLMGFRQIDQLPVFYGLAKALVAASTKDTWNLTVNEAMAGGLPVLVSRACGCVPELVQPGVNGLTFDPLDVDALADLLRRVADGEFDLAAMGRASRKIIAQWSPETFARSLWQACRCAMGHAAQRRRARLPNPLLWF